MPRRSSGQALAGRHRAMAAAQRPAQRAADARQEPPAARRLRRSLAHAAAASRPPADKSKAAKAAKAVKKSQFKKDRKKRYSVVFHRPKTLIRARDPKFPRTRCGGRPHAQGGRSGLAWLAQRAAGCWR